MLEVLVQRLRLVRGRTVNWDGWLDPPDTRITQAADEH